MQLVRTDRTVEALWLPPNMILSEGHQSVWTRNKVTTNCIFHSGASSGIGRATAVEFAKHGVKVTIAGRNAERLEETAQLCYKEGLKEKDVSGWKKGLFRTKLNFDVWPCSRFGSFFWVLVISILSLFRISISNFHADSTGVEHTAFVARLESGQVLPTAFPWLRISCMGKIHMQ